MSEKIKDLEGEIWKDVEGFEGRYQVSNKGRVKSLVRPKVKRDRILRHKNHNRGYCLVSLTKNSKTYDRLVHRLVAKVFIDNPNEVEFDTVDHIDEDKTNNCVENLRWMSNLSNWKRSNMGEKNSGSKMTEKGVIEMRELHKTGKFTHKKLAEKFNISSAQVCVIINRKNWKDV